MVLNKTTKDINNPNLIFNKTHASEQMSQITKDIDMLDTNVSFTSNPIKHVVKVAMQNNTYNDPITPTKNQCTTNNTTLPSEHISNKPSINQNIKQHLSSRSAYPPKPEHVSQMATNEEQSSQMANHQINAMELEAQPINSSLGVSNNMQRPSPIITLATIPLLIPTSPPSRIIA